MLSYEDFVKKYAGVPGVYAFRCQVSKKLYVGESNDVQSRVKQHFSQLNRDCHPLRNLQKDYHTHGRESFKFLLLLEEVDRGRREFLELQVSLLERSSLWARVEKNRIAQIEHGDFTEDVFQYIDKLYKKKNETGHRKFSFLEIAEKGKRLSRFR